MTVLKNDKTWYTVFTPYKNKWIKKLNEHSTILDYTLINTGNFVKIQIKFPDINELGF